MFTHKHSVFYDMNFTLYIYYIKYLSMYILLDCYNYVNLPTTHSL